jgi:predicted metal-binding membrane protein
MKGPTNAERLLGRERRIIAGALALVVLISAAFVLAGGGTGMSPVAMTGTTGPGGALIAGTPDMFGAEVWSTRYALVIFSMWWLMMVAMMVPSAAPTILLYGALNRASGPGAALEFLAGYLVAWAGFSLLATGAQAALAAAGLVSPMYMNLALPWLGAAVLIGAGAYQLTPLKAACLDHCRGPVAALTRHRRTGPLAAFRMGLLHGTYCLGCCWALMALLFVGGVMNIWWIIGITGFVAVEKLAPGGARLTRPLGAVLIVAGLGLLARSAGVV